MQDRVHQYYAALMGDTDGILVTLDGHGTVLWISPEVTPIMGYDPDFVTGQPVADFLAPEEVAQGLRKIGDLLANPRALLRTVQRVRHADGTYRTVEMVGRDLRDRPEVGAVVVHMRDITDERQVLEALAESQARLEEAYRIAGLGWWELDTATGALQCSDQLLRLAGWQRQERFTWSDLRERLVHPDDVRRLEATLARNRTVERPVSLEHRVVRPDGSVQHWLVHAQGFADGQGRVVRIAGTVMDVTQRRKAEEQVLHAQKLEALDLLAAGIAHDFNNLLAVVQGNLSLALETVVGHPASPLLTDAEAACGRAAFLARQLSAYARGAEVRTYMPTPLAPLVRNMVPFLVRGSRVRADLDVADDLCPVQGDAAELSQVLQNLVLNAVAAMPEGGVLHVAAKNILLPEGGPELPLARGPYVLLTVEDTGRGIAPEHLSRIFDPYFTTRSEGHGLGLTTTYRIVRRHQGHITVHSRAGKGTFFQVFLPASGVGTAAGEAAPGRAPVAGLRPNLRVLMVDDEALIRTAAAHMLEELGCHAEFAESSEQAIALVRGAIGRGRPFHLAILDLTLPGDRSAPELYKSLWAIDPMLRGIVSSGYAQHERMLHYRLDGFRAALPKPYGLAELRETLAAALADAPPPMTRS